MLEVGPRDVVGDQERIVDLQEKARVDDRLVFLAHRRGDGEHVFLGRLVMLVRRRRLDVRRRDRRHEGLRGVRGLHGGLEVVELDLQPVVTLVFDRRGADHQRAAARRAHLLGRLELVEFRIVPGLARGGERARPRARALLQAIEPLRRIGDEARLAHLAVIDDVETHVDLMLDGVLHGLGHARVVGLLVDRLAVEPLHHHVHQVVGARQAADMGGQDPVGAELHQSFPSCRESR